MDSESICRSCVDEITVRIAGRKREMLERIQFWTALILLFFAFPMLAQERASKLQRPDAPASSDTKKAATTDPNYVIGSQDVLDINVWKEPDLSRTVPVRPDGKISLPLLNDIQATGLTPSQLAAEVTKDLSKFVTNAQVTIIVTQINSQRFYVLGEAARPGAYTLIPDMTILQALS